MQLSNFIKPNLVWSDLKADNKQAIIREIAGNISLQKTFLSTSLITDILLKREELGSTGIEDGVAIPHAKMEQVDEPILAIARSKNGIDFHAHDGNPTFLFFVLLAPTKSSTAHLKLLARLSRLLKSPGLRKNLLNAADSLAIYNKILDEDKKL